jgi:hypothetical protein
VAGGGMIIFAGSEHREKGTCSVKYVWAFTVVIKRARDLHDNDFMFSLYYIGPDTKTEPHLIFVKHKVNFG